MRKIIVILLSCGLFLPACTVTKIPGNPDNYAEMTLWKPEVMGAIYNKATDSVAYNRPDADGTYHIYISDSDGNNEVPLTYGLWPANRHQWAEEWDPTGQFLFCHVEKTDYVRESDHRRSPKDAIPGYGAYTDIWIIKRDGSRAWKLTDAPNNYDSAITHAAISADGRKYAWTERIKRPNFFSLNLLAGAYVFRVADVTYFPEPKFRNIRTYNPGGVPAGGEVESISPDGSDMLIYSTFETKNLIATPIYRVDLATGAATKLTEESYAQTPTYTPDGKKIVYMTGAYADIFPFQLQGADWWVMDRDGSNKKRLTYMNLKDHAQSVNAYRLAGSLSFINNNTFLGAVMTFPFGLTGYTAKVTFDTGSAP